MDAPKLTTVAVEQEQLIKLAMELLRDELKSLSEILECTAQRMQVQEARNVEKLVQETIDRIKQGMRPN